MLPLYALLGMWGVMWVMQMLKNTRVFTPVLLRGLLPTLLLLVAAMNLYQAYIISPVRFGPSQTAEALFVGITQSIQKAEPNSPKNFVVILGKTWGVEGLVEFQNVYPHLAWFQIYKIKIEDPVLPAAELPLLSERNTLIMVSPYLDPVWKTALDEPLQALGKARCVVTTLDGQERFVLYYAVDLPSACPKR
jgi:hypothetical protein